MRLCLCQTLAHRINKKGQKGPMSSPHLLASIIPFLDNSSRRPLPWHLAQKEDEMGCPFTTFPSLLCHTVGLIPSQTKWSSLRVDGGRCHAPSHQKWASLIWPYRLIPPPNHPPFPPFSITTRGINNEGGIARTD